MFVVKKGFKHVVTSLVQSANCDMFLCTTLNSFPCRTLSNTSRLTSPLMNLFGSSRTGIVTTTPTITSSNGLICRSPPNYTQIRGFKDKATLQLRCKDCYYKKIDYRWWVMCPTHPRHKQREVLDDVKRKWIVTHITNGGRPFQKKEESYICNLAPPGPYDYRLKMFFKPDPRNVVIPKKQRPGLHRKLAVTPYNGPN